MSERWIPTLEDYIELAAAVLGTAPESIRGLPRLTLAESALRAPFAGFGDRDVYPELVTQAAVLITHLAQNHPLPDGNKRAAFLMMARFLEANGAIWAAADIERDAGMVERMAAGQAELDEVVAWVVERTRVS